MTHRLVLLGSAAAALSLCFVSELLAQPTASKESQAAKATAKATTKTPVVTRIQLDNGEWIVVDDTEIIHVFAERSAKPIERDTELRLTGKELLARGSTTLADALDQIPQLQVRTGGRGGVQVNIRGGRKGAIKVLIDGVPVDEVFNGNFDISQIPVTDISQIRVSLSPASPLDGIGGPAGVIEVHTLDAVGSPLAKIRAYGSSLPTADLSFTGRTEITERIAIRGSLTAALGMREFRVANANGMMTDVDEQRRALTGAVRVEYRSRRDRIALDISTVDRHFLVPPGEDGVEDIIMIDSDAATRIGLTADIERAHWRLQGRSYVQTLDRTSIRYAQPSLTDGRPERVRGTRVGGALVAHRSLTPKLAALTTVTIDGEQGQLNTSNGTTVKGTSTMSELAAGVQMKHQHLSADATIGLAVPLTAGSGRPWPEAKLSGTYAPVPALELKLTVARKGRLPTLRERFRPDVGNPDLNPEKTSFIEIGTTLHPRAGLRLKSSAYIRDTDGQIRFSLDRGGLTNVNNLVIRGIDSDIDVEVSRFVSIGASYTMVDSYSPTFGLDSLDFLPRHRVEARVGGKFDRGSARLRVRYQSSQIDQTTTIAPRTTIDLSAFMSITNNITATVRFDNMLGDRYVLRRGGLLAPGRVLTIAVQSMWK